MSAGPLRTILIRPITLTNLVRSGSSGDDGDDRTDHLSEREGRAHMQPRQGLQQDHTETHTLDGIENTEPEPQASSPLTSSGANQSPRSTALKTPAMNSQVGTGDSSPRYVKTDTRDSPPHLTPPRASETDGEDGKQPRVDLRVVCEDVGR